MALAAAVPGIALAQQPVPNIDILRDLIARAASEVKAELGPGRADRVDVRVLPADIAWAVDGGVLAAFAPTVPADSADVHAVFGLRDVRIVYASQERDGLFGPLTAERRVRLLLAVRVTGDGAAPVTRDIPLEYTDRIRVDDIPAVDHPTVGIARGTLEGRGLFMDVAEPLVLLGAVGVAVFLLFHVRS